MGGDLTPAGPGEFILYQTEDGTTRLRVRVENETVWLSQRGMAELFQTTVPNINQHLTAICEEGELERKATIKRYLIVRSEGKRQVSREIEHYNLDVIISVGYRVKSLRGTQFRIWATQRLREYIVKGFTMDDERLKASFMPRAWTTIPARPRRLSFSRRSRTRCIGRSRGRPPLKSSTAGPTLASHGWG